MQNLVFTQLSIPELRKVIRDEQEAILKDFFDSLQTTKEEDNEAVMYINKKEAAKLWGCCTSTIDNKAREGIIKRYYIGKAVRFKKSEVLEAIEEMNKKRR